jgi:hypothetical protein
MMDLFIIHVVIFLFFVIYFFNKNIETTRLKSLYNLYDIRDRLIYLVASDITDEKNKLFSYYYTRINHILKLTPNVGLDDLLDQLTRNSTSIESSIRKAKKELNEVLSDHLMENNEVKQIVEDYYNGVRTLVLSHSSLFKMGYILSKQFSLFYKSISFIFDKFSFGHVYKAAYKVTNFAEKEANDIHRRKFAM